MHSPKRLRIWWPITNEVSSTRRALCCGTTTRRNSLFSNNKFQSRAVVPQQAYSKDEQLQTKPAPQSKQLVEESGNISKVAPSETEFRQLIGDASDGKLARFVDDKLNLLFWYRPP